MLPLLRRSAQALQSGFVAACAGGGWQAAHHCSCARTNRTDRSQHGATHAHCDRRLQRAPRRFHLGTRFTLVLALAQCPLRSKRSPDCGTRRRLARLPDRFAPRPLSNGKRARLRFGATGARGEARAAFPHAIAVGLPTLREARERGVPEDCARPGALAATSWPALSTIPVSFIAAGMPQLGHRRREPEPCSRPGGRPPRPDSNASATFIPN